MLYFYTCYTLHLFQFCTCYVIEMFPINSPVSLIGIKMFSQFIYYIKLLLYYTLQLFYILQLATRVCRETASLPDMS